ncbi:MAG: outer membrane beta-barrel family protein [Chryseobacterium sp.]|uniref:outer membrane beta-barrel family protein n=1 Tax=Chryseobacterium sp. TaxID=1871047 RepID=UPI0025BF448C|nr:outer membrane beta-barrel family protein [Chryseobacterium sp.]MCJ7934612.1 outer membrane beta-barrel family protein [Chryseobacterium sp.]
MKPIFALIITLFCIKLSFSQKQDTLKDKQSLNQIEAIVLKSQKPIIERQLEKTVFQVEKSITNTGITVLEVIRKIPGIQISQEGQLSLNGKNGVTVLIDGKSTYLSADDLSILLNSMQASTLQTIEVMSNPTSKYDAGGNSIINIIKKKNYTEGFSGSINGTLRNGYYGDFNIGTVLNYQNKYINLSFNNTYTLTKSFFNRDVTSNIFSHQSLLKKQISDNDNISTNRSYLPSLNADFYLSKKSTLSLNSSLAVLSGKSLTSSDMNTFNGQDDLIEKQVFNGIGNSHPLNFSAGLHFNHKMDTLSKQISFDINYSSYENRPQQFNNTMINYSIHEQPSEKNILLNQYRKLNIYAINADYIYPLANKGKLETGVKFSYVKVNNENSFYNVIGGQNKIDSLQSSYSINTENINAAYINYSQTWKKISMQAGIRSEQTVMRGERFPEHRVAQNYLQIFPTLFLSYTLNSDNSFILRMGRRVERASYSQMVPFKRPLTPTLYFQGNPLLQPQTSIHSEIGWTWKNSIFLTMSYDAYRNYIQTLPYADSNQTTITRIPTNIRGVQAWNMEISYSKKILNWWSANYSISLYRNYFKGSVEQFSLNNNGITSLSLNANNSFTINNKFSIAIDFEHNSRRQLATSSFGPYSILNIGIKYQMLHNKATLSLVGSNLLQSESHDAIDHYENLNQSSYWNYYTRSVRLSFNYRFGLGKSSSQNKSNSEEQQRAGN